MDTSWCCYKESMGSIDWKKVRTSNISTNVVQRHKRLTLKLRPGTIMSKLRFDEELIHSEDVVRSWTVWASQISCTRPVGRDMRRTLKISPHLHTLLLFLSKDLGSAEAGTLWQNESSMDRISGKNAFCFFLLRFFLYFLVSRIFLTIFRCL